MNNILCLDCQLEDDSPIHKIFYCTAFETEHRDELIKEMKSDFASDYRLKFLFSADIEIRKLFKKQIKYICNHSKFDDEYNQM